MLVFRRTDAGVWSPEDERRDITGHRRRLGRIYHYRLWCVPLGEVMSGFDSQSAVDQPPGTGYSYTGTNSYVHELTEVTRDLRCFTLYAKLFLRLLVNIWNS